MTEGVPAVEEGYWCIRKDGDAPRCVVRLNGEFTVADLERVLAGLKDFQDHVTVAD